MVHAIDYAVYQHMYEKTNEFMAYLKENDFHALVKPYCLRFDYAALLVEELLQQHIVLLRKIEENYCCQIDHQFVGISAYPSMAICLAIIDMKGEKENYEETANQLVKEDIKERKRLTEELEERLKKNR